MIWVKALKYENRERAEAEKGSSETIEIVDAWAEDVRGATDDL